MRYQQDLQVKLRDRLRKLITAKYSAAAHEVRLVVEWIDDRPPLNVDPYAGLNARNPILT